MVLSLLRSNAMAIVGPLSSYTVPNLTHKLTDLHVRVCSCTQGDGLVVRRSPHYLASMKSWIWVVASPMPFMS